MPSRRRRRRPVKQRTSSSSSSSGGRGCSSGRRGDRPSTQAQELPREDVAERRASRQSQRDAVELPAGRYATAPRLRWSQLLLQTFDVDVMECPKCKGCLAWSRLSSRRTLRAASSNDSGSQPSRRACSVPAPRPRSDHARRRDARRRVASDASPRQPCALGPGQAGRRYGVTATRMKHKRRRGGPPRAAAREP